MSEEQPMSPSAALSSDVFRIYAGVVLGLLVAGGLLIAVLRWGLHRNVSHAWQSYTSWLVMVPLVLLRHLCRPRAVRSCSSRCWPSSPSRSMPGPPGSIAIG